MAKIEVEEMRTVFIPKESRNDLERYISVNGERIMVQTGKSVEVPVRFAEVLDNTVRMENEAQKFISNNIQLG